MPRGTTGQTAGKFLFAGQPAGNEFDRLVEHMDPATGGAGQVQIRAFHGVESPTAFAFETDARHGETEMDCIAILKQLPGTRQETVARSCRKRAVGWLSLHHVSFNEKGQGLVRFVPGIGIVALVDGYEMKTVVAQARLSCCHPA